MILACYGVAGIGPAELSSIIGNAGLAHGVYIGPQFTKKKEEDQEWPDRIPAVFGGVRTFLRHHQKLQKSPKHMIAFVIDTPADLYALVGCIPLGIERLGRHLAKFNELATDQIIDVIHRPYLSDEEAIPEYSYQAPPVLQQVIGMFKDSSMLPALQTLMYKIKNQEQRAKAFSLVKQWLSTTMPYADFQRKLRRTVDHNVYLKYCLILETPDIKRLKAAVVQAKKNPSAYKKIAAKYRVSDYDVKYLVKTSVDKGGK